METGTSEKIISMDHVTTAYGVSIIIPVQDEGTWLLNTLRSIEENAGIPRCEYDVILVNDHSTDDAFELVDKAELDLNIVRIDLQDNDRGPGVARQRGIEAADRYYLFTCDAHMVFPKNFLYDLRSLTFKYPHSVIIGASTGFRSVKDHRIFDMPKMDMDSVKSMCDALDTEWHQPIIVEFPEKHQDIKYSLREQLKCTVIFSKTDHPIIHVKSWRLDPEMPDSFQSWGCRLQYDPGDRNFFTPKWNTAFSKKSPPNANCDVIRINGLMGASYFMSRDLLINKIGGWTQYQGWVHEEEYLSIACNMTGIPIYCARNVMVAHNYDRFSMTMQNVDNQKLNKYAILEMCFDELKPEMYKQLFKIDVPTIIHPDWVYDYQAKVKANKVITDRQFIHDNGFSVFFDSATKKKMKEVFGLLGGGDNKSEPQSVGELAKTMNVEAIFEVLNGWVENKGIKSIFVAGVYQGDPKGFSKIEADRNDFYLVTTNLWDNAKGCRSLTLSRLELNHLLGMVHSVAIAESFKVTGVLEATFGNLVKQHQAKQQKEGG